MGIAPENLPRIFTQGFTTKKDGPRLRPAHQRPGRQEMKGSLTCVSAGPGQGATFTIELPLTARAGPRMSMPASPRRRILDHRRQPLHPSGLPEDPRRPPGAAPRWTRWRRRSSALPRPGPAARTPSRWTRPPRARRASSGSGGRGREGRPYALAFVDIRMPPGIDGVETTARLWKADPDLQVVLCSAYADYSWEEVARRLGINQRLLILRKPFDNIEVRQMAHALAQKWDSVLAEPAPRGGAGPGGGHADEGARGRQRAAAPGDGGPRPAGGAAGAVPAAGGHGAAGVGDGQRDQQPAGLREHQPEPPAPGAGERTAGRPARGPAEACWRPARMPSRGRIGSSGSSRT